MRIFKIFIFILLFSFPLTINLQADSEKMALGLEVYNNKAACGACHILKAAGSEGNIGPNLDILKPTEEQVKLIVTEARSNASVWRGGYINFRRDRCCFTLCF